MDSGSLGIRLVQADSWVVGGYGLVVVGALWVLLRLVLPSNRRTELRFPLVCLLVNFTGSIFHHSLGGAGRGMWNLALFGLLLAVGRLSFLLVVDVLVVLRRKTPVPAIFKDIGQALVYAAVVFVSLRQAGVEPGSLLTSGALLTAVIGLALQETLGNLVAGLAIQAQRPFEVGDYIQFDNEPRHIGQVVEINWRATRIITEDRVEMVVPNGPLAKSAIKNFTKPDPNLRRSVVFAVPQSLVPLRVKEAVLRAVGGLAHVATEPAPTVLINAWKDKDQHVEYVLQYVVEKFEERERVDSAMRERVWYALERAGVFPRVVVGEAELAAVEQRLLAIDFLAALTPEQRAQLARAVEKRTYLNGETIITQGDEGNEFFILQKGVVRIVVGGNEVARLQQGAFFGEMSLLTGERRTATVNAVGDVQLLVVGHAAFNAVLTVNPGVVEQISQVVAARQVALARAREEHLPAEGDAVAQRTTQLLGRIRSFFSLG